MNLGLFNKRYLAAGQYTIADMICYPWASSWATRKIEIDEFPNVKRGWKRSASGRPSRRPWPWARRSGRIRLGSEPRSRPAVEDSLQTSGRSRFPRGGRALRSAFVGSGTTLRLEGPRPRRSGSDRPRLGKLTRASNDPIYLLDGDPDANACLANAPRVPDRQPACRSSLPSRALRASRPVKFVSRQKWGSSANPRSIASVKVSRDSGFRKAARPRRMKSICVRFFC